MTIITDLERKALLEIPVQSGEVILDSEYIGGGYPPTTIEIKGYPTKLKKVRKVKTMTDEWSDPATFTVTQQAFPVFCDVSFFTYYDGGDDSVGQGYVCYPALQTIRFYDSEGFECFRGLSEALMPMPYDEPIPLEITEGDARICRLKNPKISEFLLPLLEAGRKLFNLNN